MRKSRKALNYVKAQLNYGGRTGRRLMPIHDAASIHSTTAAPASPPIAHSTIPPAPRMRVPAKVSRFHRRILRVTDLSERPFLNFAGPQTVCVLITKTSQPESCPLF
jgi:hypothetical protein